MFERLYVQTETEDARDERMREAERLRREQTAEIIAERDAADRKAGRGKSSRELNKMIDGVEKADRELLDGLRVELEATEAAIRDHELTTLHLRRDELRRQIRERHSTSAARLVRLRGFLMESLTRERPPESNIVVRGIGRLAGALTEGNDEN
jgi:hypothetical protein